MNKTKGGSPKTKYPIAPVHDTPSDRNLLWNDMWPQSTLAGSRNVTELSQMLEGIVFNNVMFFVLGFKIQEHLSTNVYMIYGIWWNCHWSLVWQPSLNSKVYVIIHIYVYTIIDHLEYYICLFWILSPTGLLRVQQPYSSSHRGKAGLKML